ALQENERLGVKAFDFTTKATTKPKKSQPKSFVTVPGAPPQVDVAVIIPRLSPCASDSRINSLAQRFRLQFARVLSHPGFDNHELSHSTAGLGLRSRKAWEPPHVRPQA